MSEFHPPTTAPTTRPRVTGERITINRSPVCFGRTQHTRRTTRRARRRRRRRPPGRNNLNFVVSYANRFDRFGDARRAVVVEKGIFERVDASRRGAAVCPSESAPTRRDPPWNPRARDVWWTRANGRTNAKSFRAFDSRSGRIEDVTRRRRRRRGSNDGADRRRQTDGRSASAAAFCDYIWWRDEFHPCR